MIFDIQTILWHGALPLGIALILGWGVKAFVVPKLIKLTHKTAWKSDDLVIGVIKKHIITWFLLVALLYTVRNINLNDKYLEWANKGLIGILIFTLTIAAAKIGAGLTTIRSAREDVELPDSSILSNIIKVVIYVLGFMLILQSAGVQITPLLTALGVGGLAVALALQDTLSNLFAGIQLVSSGKTNIGDFIELENGKRGFITDINWRNTTVQTVSNNTVVVPNSTLSNSIVENFFLEDKCITFKVLVGVGYDSDLDLVERVSIEEAVKTLNTVEGGVTDFEPFVRFYNFGASSIDLKIFLRVKEFSDQFAVTSELIKNISRRYKKEGINIPFPIRTVIQG